MQGSLFESGAGVGLLEPPPPVERRRGARPDSGGGGSWPPWDEGGDGGGGGGGDDDTPPDSSPDDSGNPAAFGLGLALAAIGTLFVAFLGAFLMLRNNAPEWPPADAPAPPVGMWVSTLILLVSSATMARAVAAARREDTARAARSMLATLVLGGLFLVAQARLWGDLFTGGFFPSSSGYGSIFFALTGLHAAHIVGGLVYVAAVGLRLRRRRRLRSGGAPDAQGALSPARSVPLCAVYWHFMGGVWVVLVAALWI